MFFMMSAIAQGVALWAGFTTFVGVPVCYFNSKDCQKLENDTIGDQGIASHIKFGGDKVFETFSNKMSDAASFASNTSIGRKINYALTADITYEETCSWDGASASTENGAETPPLPLAETPSYQSASSWYIAIPVVLAIGIGSVALYQSYFAQKNEKEKKSV